MYLTSRIQPLQQFVGLADLGESAPARGFHRCDGFGIRIERLERQGLFRRDAHQQQAEGIGQGEPDFLQRRGGFPLGALIDAGDSWATMWPTSNITLVEADILSTYQS